MKNNANRSRRGFKMKINFISQVRTLTVKIPPVRETNSPYPF